MTTLPRIRVPQLEPAGTVVSGPPKRSLGSRLVGRLGGGVLQLLVGLVAVLWLLPTVGLLVSSFRPGTASDGWWHALTSPSSLMTENYTKIFTDPTIMGSLWNSVLITVPSTVLVVVLGAMAAYALAWLEFKGRDWMFIVVVSLTVVPVQVALIPDAIIFRYLGMFGHIPAVVAFHTAFGLPFAIFLMRNFFIGIPRDLLEAARMDGARELAVFTRVILPVGWPAIASLAIFQFVFVWNDLLVALVFAGPGSKPITQALAEQMRSFEDNITIIGPGAFLSMLVPLIVFFSFQRYFVQGVLAGSVK
jgi:alpha-glucoside transport system permease protein